MAVAVNWRRVPMGIEAPTGLTEMSTITASVTVTVVCPVRPMYAAEMAAVPVATAVTRPRFRTVATPATLGALETHVARLVTLRVVPSEKMAVAVNCATVPTGSVGAMGVTSSDTGTATVTVSVVEAEKPMYVAPIVVVPCATGVARPVPLIVAAIGFEDDHCVWAVTLRVVPFERMSVAVYCTAVPSGVDTAMG